MEGQAMPENPKSGDKLYTAFNGKLKVVTFVREEYAPQMGNIPAESRLSYLCKDSDDKRFNCSPDMYCRTELEAWQKYYKECTEAIGPAKQHLEEAERQLNFVAQETEKAALKVHLALKPKKLMVIVGDDYGPKYYGPFDQPKDVEAWIGKNLEWNLSLGLEGDRVTMRYLDGTKPRPPVAIRQIGLEFEPTIVRDGH
jgi:hypothetical protein